MIRDISINSSEAAEGATAASERLKDRGKELDKDDQVWRSARKNKNLIKNRIVKRQNGNDNKSDLITHRKIASDRAQHENAAAQ